MTGSTPVLAILQGSVHRLFVEYEGSTLIPFGIPLLIALLLIGGGIVLAVAITSR